MPLKVRRFCTSLVFVVFALLAVQAQTPTPTQVSIQTPTQATNPVIPPAPAPTSGEIMRARVSKAKALIATRNYPAAIYELENIRRETSDQAVHSVLNVLLMNCYLEQSDYKRAQDFLTDLYNGIKSGKPNAASNYYAAAGQVIKGARNQSDRYKSLGLSVSDPNLDQTAVADLDKMRGALELVVTQSQAIAKDPKQTANAFAVIEEAGNARSILARDSYDSKRWKEEVADSREMLSNSTSTVFNAMGDEQPAVTNTAVNNPTSAPTNVLPTPASDPKPTSTVEQPPVMKPVESAKTDVVKTENPNASTETVAKTDEPKAPSRERRVEERKESTEQPTNSDGSLNVGSLLEYAVQKSNPVYPASARTLGQKGVVRVEVLVDESGQVAAVQNSSGPMLLQGAAKDAVRKWRFRPFVRDGQPVKATGYLNFNFSL